MIVRSSTLLALASLATPLAASAQDAAPPDSASAVSEPESPEYSAAIDAALSEFQARRWPEARAHFRRAHALSPNARTLRGIGMASYEMADYASAYEALEGALTNPTRPLTDEQHAQVASLRDRALALIGRYTLPACEGARVLVDDVPVTPGGAWPAADGELILTLGAHSVLMRRARGTDTVSSRTRVEVAGGENGALLDLACPDRTGPNGPPANSGETDLTPWVVAGIGGAVLIGGIVLTAIGFSEISTVEGATLGTEWSTLQGANERGPILTGIGIPLLILGAGTTLTGVGWGLVNLPNGGARSSAQLRITPLSVGLSGSFK